MWKGHWVGLEIVTRWVFYYYFQWAIHIFIQTVIHIKQLWRVLTLWHNHSIVYLSRKVDSVTVSQMPRDIHVTPVRMDTSCCRKRSILVVKVRNLFELNFLGWHFNWSKATCKTLAVQYRFFNSLSNDVFCPLTGCQCDLGGGDGVACNDVSGQCLCRKNVVGRKCTEWDMAGFIVIVYWNISLFSRFSKTNF